MRNYTEQLYCLYAQGSSLEITWPVSFGGTETSQVPQDSGIVPRLNILIPLELFRLFYWTTTQNKL